MTSSISDKTKESLLKTAFTYLLCAVFTAFFGAVYELFSHGVYSYFMIYAFAIPLLLGTVPFLIAALWGRKHPGRISLNAWNSGVAALTVGCIIKGVLDIYGTTNRLIRAYPIAGAALLIIGLISYLYEKDNTAPLIEQGAE